MSRCYPYLRSSRSSVRNGTGNGNGGCDLPLIQSFKLQSKNEKPKTEQVKEKGRDKERKIRWKRKEDKPSDFIDGKFKKLKNDECYLGEKYADGFSDSCLPEGSEGGKAESLDNSGLTEEHDEPLSVYLSDITQSSKRKRDSTPSSSGITVHRNILRIRLPSQKQREHDALPRKEQLHPTAGKVADSRDQRETVRVSVKEEQYCSINRINREVPSPVLDSAKEEKVVPSGSKAAVGATSYESEIQRTESMYQSLMDNLVLNPHILQSEMDMNDDQEWLFGTKQRRQASKTLKASDDISCRQSSGMWPQAHFLPEADIYSLPYTIPF